MPAIRAVINSTTPNAKPKRVPILILLPDPISVSVLVGAMLALVFVPEQFALAAGCLCR
jgi:hypothetical protein